MSTRAQRLSALADIHYQWSQDWQHLPVPDRPGSKDVSVHHIDASGNPEADADFMRRGEQIP